MIKYLASFIENNEVRQEEYVMIAIATISIGYSTMNVNVSAC